MATRNDIKDSNFLTKEDCEPAIEVTVSRCVEEDVSMANEPAKMKYVLYFMEQEKGLILNLTNWDRIEAISKEPDSDNWDGTVITLFNDPTVDYGGKMVGVIRVWVPQVVPAGIRQTQQAAAPVTQQPHIGEGPPPPTDADIPANLDSPPGRPNPDYSENPPPPPPGEKY